MPGNPCTQQYPVLPCWLVMGCQYTHHQLLHSSFGQRNMPPPVWRRSCHIKKLDVALNDTLRLITGCLCPTPTGILRILADIAPPNLRREQLTYTLRCQAAFNNQHPLYGSIPDLQSLQPQRQKSRQPFQRPAAALIASGFEINRA